MTVHFAATRSLATSPVTRFLARRAMGAAANDNGDDAKSDHLLHAALRQFAEHGLGAAKHARAQAESAFFTGDREAYDWWLGICRALDRRLADSCAQMAQDKSS